MSIGQKAFQVSGFRIKTNGLNGLNGRCRKGPDTRSSTYYKEGLLHTMSTEFQGAFNKLNICGA